MPTHEHMVGSHGEGRPTRRDKGKEGQHGIESARTEERAGAVWHSHGASDPVWGIQVSKELNWQVINQMTFMLLYSSRSLRGWGWYTKQRSRESFNKTKKGCAFYYVVTVIIILVFIIIIVFMIQTLSALVSVNL